MATASGGSVADVVAASEAILAELQGFRAESMQNAVVIALIVSALFGATVAAVVVLCFGRWFRR